MHGSLAPLTSVAPSATQDGPLIPAGETGPSPDVTGAEGATAPETLRPKDRGELALWKAAMRQRIAHRRA